MNHFEKLLLHTFCPQMIFIFPFPSGITEISEKKQFDPLKLSATRIFLVGYLYRSVIPHHRKKIENRRGYTSFFFSFFLFGRFFWNTLYFFYLYFFIFYYFFSAIRNSKMINLKLLTLKLSELRPFKV